MAFPKLVYLVVSDGPQRGKTTVSNFIALYKHCERISSSDAILPRVSKLVGIPPEEIRMRRLTDPDFCRKELIEEGNRMAEEGYPPGLACLDMLTGSRIVIDGIRRVEELLKMLEKAKRENFKIFVIGIIRPGMNGCSVDNTEKEIFQYVDYTIVNDKGLQELYNKTIEVVRNIDSRLSKEVEEVSNKTL